MAYFRCALLATLLFGCGSPTYRDTSRKPVAEVCVRNEAYPVIVVRMFVRARQVHRVTLGTLGEERCWGLATPLETVYLTVEMFGHDWVQESDQMTVGEGTRMVVEVREAGWTLHLRTWLENMGEDG